jgi:hypothetical protein
MGLNSIVVVVTLLLIVVTTIMMTTIVEWGDSVGAFAAATTSLVDPPHCDQPGFPSCYSVGYHDGYKAGYNCLSNWTQPKLLCGMESWSR